jgi:excisionase family DNA binding protein
MPTLEERPAMTDAITPSAPAFYTVQELADLLRVDHKTVRSAISAGQIRVVRLGRTIRIPRAVVESMLAQDRVVPPMGGTHGRKTQQ